MIKATVGSVPVEIWFTPSFNIKTTDKRLELLLRNVSFEVFDPWETRMREVKATKSIIDAYLVLEEYRFKVPEMKITFEEAPELPNSFDQGSEENPVVH
ncbi:hypothetical protein HV417_02175 [Bacillus sporothermodurans]|uniref:hypothetical protein n=1 Tax=Heyndrickxia sporothermodurans TaxID=46224 RepID=UPI00192BDA01|nr:hypothetical protein [Heyndrickxia sporothermodurans]MBL5830872.1 hypothetical protein [Heyndrickxia sporothermodurans]MBL5872370.1 hypothetical protein [Heyndrickxia sporothermodurans]